MESQAWLVIGVVVVLLALAALAVFARVTRRAAGGSRLALESQQWVATARHEAGERMSSPVAEEIEEVVRARLSAYPDLARAKVDFGCAADGSLEIWVDQTQYHAVSDIPDPRLRQAIQDAVQAWNEKKRG